MLAASEAADLREIQPYEASVAAWLSRNGIGFEAPRFAVAREGGQLVGYVSARVSEEKANSHLALTHLAVLPQHRRRGTGTALLRALPSPMSGRTVAEAWHVFKDTAG